MKKKLLGLAMFGMLLSASLPAVNAMAATENMPVTNVMSEMESGTTIAPRIGEYGYATVINCTSLTVRSSASNSASAVGWLQAGDRVTVCQNISGVSGWTYISFDKGNGTYQYGFVGSSYLTPRYY